MHVGRRHPDIGETVGEYKVIERIGSGGLGVVYKVERGGRFFAMKFLLIPRLDGRAKREISILNHLDNPCCVRYIGSDYWPNPTTGLPFIVMEYVPGDTLEEFVLRHNPAARKVTRILLDMARTLGEVHAKGVFHRDLKPSNVIIRGAAERPVLIDFGVASLAGAVGLTASPLPPGTDEYRAPEPLRFERDNAGKSSRYEFGCSDELWALGVTFYGLLTDEMPFGERSGLGGTDALYERILSQRPVEPHKLNTRVPLPVSALCMKMLAEWPADRFQNVPELCAALQEILTKSEDDPAWDVPLIDANDAQLTTTAEDPALREPNEVLRTYRQIGKQRPRRGQVAVGGEQLAPQPEPALPLVAGAEQDGITTVEATGALVPVRDPELPAVAPAEPPDGEQLAPARVARPRHSRRLLVLVAALVAGVAVSASLGFWWLGDGTGGKTAPVGLENPPHKSPWTLSTDWGVRGPEVAIAWEPTQSLSPVGAVPVWAQPSTPAAKTMSIQTTKTESPKSEKQRAGFRQSPKSAAVAAAVLATCTGAGCTAGNSQVRPEPPAITCPDGWQATHNRFNVGGGTVALGGTSGEAGEKTRVREGKTTAKVDNSALGLPRGSVIYGVWRFEQDRLYATFTQAEVPGQGTVPVCLVVGVVGQASMGYANGAEILCPGGLGTCPAPGSSGGSVKSFQRIHVYGAAQRF
ncbi:MAG: serine/threonine-protein kinase [Cystobacter sp.]